MLEDPGPPSGWPRGFATTRADREALLVLAHLDGRLPRERHALAWRVGSASACLEAVLDGAGSGEDIATAKRIDVRSVVERLRHLDVRAVTPADAEYHERLLDLRDPPACLFVRGRPLTDAGAAVAVVGARSCSSYGREAAMRLGSQLARTGLTVVSGAALGIDGEAHRGALAAGGHTIAVLGGGHDRPHPKRNRELIEQIAREGTVVTEYPPGVEPLARHFPARNRIIAALSLGVVIVEGAAGSGSLQTAEFGEDIGRELMAVPGPIDSELSAVPHGLIRHGAQLVAEADDVLEALRLFDRIGAVPPPLPFAEAGGTADEKAVLSVLSARPISLEAVAEDAGLDLSRTLIALSSLELRGLAGEHGGRYRKVAQPRKEAQTSSEPRSAARATSAEFG